MNPSLPTLPPARVLLAEDDPALRDLWAEVLRGEGFDVVAAADGGELVDLFWSQGPFDTLLLDEDMPRLRGRQALARLRSAGTRVPAVICSGRVEIDPEECLRLGVRFVLRKPCTLACLVSTMRAALEDRPSGQPLAP
ncbi:MAG TPA: response regulator [Vicinamibacteria bacterium]|nr:response regulator [Vicinamibacteria bacterium]